jgi:DNA-binding transcriptional regulator YdaS (Cro superfamily)
MGLPTDIDLAGNTIICQDIKTGFRNVNQNSNARQTTAAGSTLTVTRALHAGRTILLDTLTGSVVTLPAAAGTGDKYRFFVSVAPTSNNHIVKVANASDTMVGVIASVPTTIAQAVTAVSAEAAGGTDDTITMNGTTGGGIAGSYLELTDVATNLWLVNGQLVASGVLTSTLSATV